MTEDHPRRDLEVDADALDRVALIADFFAGLAEQAGEPGKQFDNVADAATFRRWSGLLRDVKEEVPFHRLKDGS